MLYGGPLGTYLSGYHAPGTAKSSTSSTPTNFSGSSGGTSGVSGLTRSRSSRYRAPSASSENATISKHNSPTNQWSNYYTPQIRRKYSDETVSESGRSRYTSSGTGSGAAGNSVAYYSSRPSPTSNFSPTASSGSMSARNTNSLRRKPIFREDNVAGAIDYRRLYETEKMETTELRTSISSIHTEIKDLKSQIEAVRKTHHPGNPEQRKFERHISEYEEELKELEKLRVESEKLKSEHRALTRVVSRLM